MAPSFWLFKRQVFSMFFLFLFASLFFLLLPVSLCLLFPLVFIVRLIFAVYPSGGKTNLMSSSGLPRLQMNTCFPWRRIRSLRADVSP